jgi:two-component system, chemotaxis family, protein-glutamate methylesterase/glutaminase
MEKQRILIVDDESNMVRILKNFLSDYDYIVDSAVNGVDALAKLRNNRYHALLTDWLMPGLNGVQLIKKIRRDIEKQPFIILVTVIDSLQAKENVIEIGADYYLPKPLNLMELLDCLKTGLTRMKQTPEKINVIAPSNNQGQLPPCVAVVLASSTAGCDALRKVFYGFPYCNAAFFVVQHGPKWMHEELVKRFQLETELNVCLAENSMGIQPGSIYFAQGGSHLIVQPKSFSIQLSSGPMENSVRPSADPLFRSAADAFGRFVIGTVLTGLGIDGTYGSAYIDAVGGAVLVQDPETTHASTMPQAIISSGLAHQSVSLEKIQVAILKNIKNLSKQLNEA